MSSLPPILVELRASSGQFSSKMGEARSEITRLRTEGASNFAKLNTVGKAAIVGLAGTVVASSIALVKGSISAASDLNESLSKTKTVFGESSAAVEAFASTADKKLGTSKQAALEAASTFGNLFTALQIGQKPAASMSTGLVKLAADLASFNNVDSETALEALRSGLLGEAEPLRKFGVSLSAARIEAEALATGIAKPVRDTQKLHDAQVALGIATDKAREAVKKHGKDSTEAASANLAMEKAARAVSAAMKGNVPELTAAQKAQAAYSIILKDTKTAQGDFSRTSGGLANQQRILSATVENLRARVGSALLPVMTAVVPVFVSLADKASALTGILSEHTTVAKVFGGIVGGVVVLALGAMVGSLVAATVAQARFAATTITTNARVLVAVTASYARMAAGALASAASSAAAMVASFATQLAAAAVWAAGMLVAGATALLPFLPIIAAVAAVGVAAYLLYKNWDTVWGGIQRVIAGVWSWIKGHWPLLLGILTGPIGLAVVYIVRHWDRIVGTVKALPGRIGAAAKGMWDGIKNAFRSAVNWIIDHWNSLSFSLPSVDTHIPGVGRVGGWTLGTPDIPRFENGGWVPGARGAARLAVVHGGEYVISNGMQAGQAPYGGPNVGGSGGAAVINLVVTLDGREVHRSNQVHELRYQERNGRRSA